MTKTAAELEAEEARAKKDADLLDEYAKAAMHRGLDKREARQFAQHRLEQFRTKKAPEHMTGEEKDKLSLGLRVRRIERDLTGTTEKMPVGATIERVAKGFKVTVPSSSQNTGHGSGETLVEALASAGFGQAE